MKRVSVELVKYIPSKVRIINDILINSHLKTFLHMHALFLASDFEDFVLNKQYYRLILGMNSSK